MSDLIILPILHCSWSQRRLLFWLRLLHDTVLIFIAPWVHHSIRSLTSADDFLWLLSQLSVSNFVLLAWAKSSLLDMTFFFYVRRKQREKRSGWDFRTLAEKLKSSPGASWFAEERNIILLQKMNNKLLAVRPSYTFRKRRAHPILPVALALPSSRPPWIALIGWKSDVGNCQGLCVRKLLLLY